MVKWEIILSTLGVFISGSAFAFVVFKFAFVGYIRGLSAEINSNKESIKRVEDDRHKCRSRCDEERKNCQAENKREYQRIYDKIERS